MSCRTLQNAAPGASLPHESAGGSLPNVSAAKLLVAAVLTADAAAMDSCNQHEWGLLNSDKSSFREPSHACCPALWQVKFLSASRVLKAEVLCLVLTPAAHLLNFSHRLPKCPQLVLYLSVTNEFYITLHTHA